MDFSLLFRPSVRADAAQLIARSHLAEHMFRSRVDVKAQEVLRFTSSNSSIRRLFFWIHLLTKDRHELCCVGRLIPTELSGLSAQLRTLSGSAWRVGRADAGRDRKTTQCCVPHIQGGLPDCAIALSNSAAACESRSIERLSNLNTSR
jgi:hypothetical protein